MSEVRSFQLGEHEVILETGSVAARAEASVLVRSRDVVVLACLTVSEEPREDAGFLPLTVEYREKAAAAGRIPGGFARRELRMSDREVLGSRMIDRGVRPLFAPGLRREVLLHTWVLSAQGDGPDPVMLAVIGAAACLHMSALPWNGPVAALRLPDPASGVLVVASRAGVVMIDGGADEVEEPELLRLLAGVGEALDPAFAALDELRIASGPEGSPPEQEAPEDLQRAETRGALFESGLRRDGRSPEALREAHCQVGWLPTPHGSALFNRGQTQASVTCTIGAPTNEQLVETLDGLERHRFMLHYNFPSFSVGEVRQPRGPGRREIGHGALAARALAPVLPGKREFPFAIRVESDILSSDGSSSMATVCGASLALMDAGVPISRSVAGVAIGLMREGDEAVLLTDILGEEDGAGDMDFKVCGTSQGVTALQLDSKIGGLGHELLGAALDRAREARARILEIMDGVLGAPREGSGGAGPAALSVSIPAASVGRFIGPKGANIKKLQQQFGVDIEVTKDGRVSVAGMSRSDAEACAERVRGQFAPIENGAVYEGRVARVLDTGIVVQLGEQADGWVHISEWEQGRTERMADVASRDDAVIVRVLGVDHRGRIRLSRKEAQQRGDEPVRRLGGGGGGRQGST